MSDVDPAATTRSPQWWLSDQGKTLGPYSEAYVLAALKTGAISPETQACPVGQSTWRRLGSQAAFAATCAACPPPPPPVGREAPPPAPWNPRTIAWLGLLFSPVWAGIMTAINTRRLQADLPLWRPLVLGIGVTVLDCFVPAGGFYVVDLALYLGAVWLIWHWDLRRQLAVFEAQGAVSPREGGWLRPSLAGSPLALLVLFGFLVAPFLPLEPREVCQGFVEAGSVKEAQAYTTTNLWPAIEAMFAQKEDPDFQGRFELTDEAEAPADVGGYLVGYRLYGEPKGEAAFLVEGFFHLKQIEGTWKIEDWYFTSFNNEPSAEPISVAANYQTIFPSVPPPAPPATLAPADAPAKARSGWLLTRWLFGSSGEKAASGEARALAAEGRALASGENAIVQKGRSLVQKLQRMGVLALAALAGLAAWGRSLLRGRGHESPKASKTSSSPFASPPPDRKA